MTQHAFLSASASDRWLHCTGSVMLTKDMPNKTSEYAEEGTRAHELCAYKLNLARGLTEIEKPEGEFDDEMKEAADAWVELIKPHLTRDAVSLVEHRVDYSSALGVEKAFGTADCIVAGGGVLRVFDFKYGKGVRVPAKNNSQMMLYAIGGYYLLNDRTIIDEVELTIFQPRINPEPSTWKLSVTELLKTVKMEFAPKAQEALQDVDDKYRHYEAGDWCRWCKAKETCRCRLEALDLDAEMAPPMLLSDEELVAWFKRLPDIKKWIEDVEKYMQEEAEGGHKWPGLELKPGKASRAWGDETKVAATLMAEGKDPYNHKLKGISEVEKELGKPRFRELLDPLTVIKNGKAKLCQGDAA